MIPKFPKISKHASLCWGDAYKTMEKNIFFHLMELCRHQLSVETLNSFIAGLVQNTQHTILLDSEGKHDSPNLIMMI